MGTQRVPAHFLLLIVAIAKYATPTISQDLLPSTYLDGVNLKPYGKIGCYLFSFTASHGHLGRELWAVLHTVLLLSVFDYTSRT
ncbi:MAG: hypothetical protein ACOC7P_00065 [Chloroflexota bacterium]